METPPIHVLLALDAQILGGKVGYGTSTPSSPVVSLNGHDDDDEDWSPESPALGRDGPATVADEGEGTTRTTTSRFWGVYWHEETKKWRAQYRDAADKKRTIGCFNDEEEAARAVNKAIRDAGLEGRRRMNERRTNPVVDGQLVPRARKASGHGKQSVRKRRRDEASTPSTRPRLA